MSDRISMHMQASTIRGLMGPRSCITVGVLFCSTRCGEAYLSFGNTYPVILIVIAD